MPWLIFLRKIPREFWYLLAVVAFFAVLRWHWIGVGVERCQEGYKKAEAAALAESIEQEKNAPVIAMEAMDIVKPTIEKRVIYVNKNNTVSCDEPYNDSLQSEIHKAEAAANRL